MPGIIEAVVTVPKGVPHTVDGPARRNWLLVSALAAFVAIALAAYLVGRGSRTPAQIVAQARPPGRTLLTAAVHRTHPKAVFVFRATLRDERPEGVSFPPPAGGLAVVSALDVHVGSVLADGGLVGAVAGSPVIVLSGAVPAYRTMAPGDSGVDIRELQEGLNAVDGLSTGEDPSGFYGPGTAAAVARLYEHYGYAPTTETTRLEGSGTASKPQRYATVPMGEVAFVTHLPATVASVPSLGAELRSGKPFVLLSSGRLLLSTETNANSASLLRKGLPGIATSDISGRSIRVRVTSVGAPQPSSDPTSGPESRVLFAPVDPAAASSLVGQNLALQVRSGSSRPVWVVPVSALITNAAGNSSVTVLVHGTPRSLRVRAGAVVQGTQVVYPLDGRLHANEQVVIGVGTK